MAIEFQQNEPTSGLRQFPVFLVASSDGLTPSTAEGGGQPQISENGAAFANTSTTLNNIGNGYYNVTLRSSEVGTLGNLTLRYKSTNTAEYNLTARVVGFDPSDSTGLGLSRLDANVASRSTHSSTDILSDATPFAGANIDATISSRSSHSSTDVIAATLTELTTGQPPAAPSLGQGVMLGYMALRNKETQSTDLYTLHDSSGGTIAQSSVTDSGSVVTKGVLVSATN